MFVCLCAYVYQECEQLQKMYACPQDERLLEHTQQQHFLYQQEQQILHQQIQVPVTHTDTDMDTHTHREPHAHCMVCISGSSVFYTSRCKSL